MGAVLVPPVLPDDPIVTRAMKASTIAEIFVDEPGQAKGTTFRRRYELPCPPQNGLRISLGEAASFVVEDLVFHVDTGTFTCRTSIEANADRPLDAVLTYYREIGYEVA